MRWQWIQFLAFQALWLVAVFGGNQWLLLCVLILVIHFIFSPSRKSDYYVLPIALLGILVDSILTLSGVFEFRSFPFWLGMLWIGFVLTLGHSLSWLGNLPRILLMPIGAIAGTLSYIAGWKLDAVELPLGLTWSIAALSTCWALLLPLMVILDNGIRKKV